MLPPIAFPAHLLVFTKHDMCQLTAALLYLTRPHHATIRCLFIKTLTFSLTKIERGKIKKRRGGRKDGNTLQRIIGRFGADIISICPRAVV